MPYRVRKTVSAKNVNGDTFVHPEGTVLSDWELSDFIRGKIEQGDDWYRQLFEPLLEREAHAFRVQATTAEGVREIEGQIVSAPFDDYVGLHPSEIMQRMQTATLEKIRQVKLFERGGMNRSEIVYYVAPAEKAPFDRYDEMSIGDILEKFSILSDADIAEAKLYESNHQQRPVILEYDKTLYERTEISEPVAVESPLPPVAPPVPVEQPQVPQMPVSPAPPVGTEGATTGVPQSLGASIPVAPSPAPAPTPVLSAPPS